MPDRLRITPFGLAIISTAATVACCVLTAFQTLLTWKMYESAVHSASGGGGVNMTTPHVSWMLPAAFGVFSLLSIAGSVLAWRTWARIAPISALQSKILILARDLLHFLGEVKPKPHPNWKEPQGRWEQPDARKQYENDSWTTKLEALYRSRFAGRVADVVSRSAEIGVSEIFVTQNAASVNSAEQVEALAGSLMWMFVKIENQRQGDL
jgi:hypothetical protein